MSDIVDFGEVVSVLKGRARFEPGRPNDTEIQAAGDLMAIEATTTETADDPAAAFELGRKLYEDLLVAAKGRLHPGALQQICAVSVRDEEDDSVTWAGGIRLVLAGWFSAAN
ncbi:hypothetical protein [Saccharopolyspora phatthalungensis]|uniref:Uncharacterized protein n=1 Tax=Saccharopolyspora phatthalungensis TaxID=664693 RepID=A0A840Q2A5_9PSEU|nr:hypothetical protein [Saccharopolyspora phatthalungensis]MBB5154564.1 hypothetical protein [Saccharopolyspora phatthalungensis]